MEVISMYAGKEAEHLQQTAAMSNLDGFVKLLP